MAGMTQLGALSLERPREVTIPKVKQDRPCFMVGGKGFFNKKDRFLSPGQITYLDEEPGLDMIPLNRKAYDSMSDLLDKLDALGFAKAKADKKDYTPFPRVEWSDEEGVINSLPLPEKVMGADKSGLPDDVVR